MEFGAEMKVVTIVLWNFVALIVNVAAFSIMYMKANKNTASKAFFVVHSGMIIWLLGKIFKTVSPTAQLRWFFIVFYYFGICLLEVSFLEFSYIYFKEKPLNKKIKNLIYVVGLIQFLVVATNPLHYLFYSVYGFWGDEFGVLFYVHVVINYSFIFTGMILCSIKFKKQIADKTAFEKSLITLAILVPLILNFIYITRTLEALFKYLNIQIFDITPIVYTWSILVFVYATFKYEFFYINPIMKHEVAKKLENPVLILDKNYKKIYANTQFNKYLNGSIITIVDIIKKDEENTIKLENKYYSYFINKYRNYDGLKIIICFTDITTYEFAKVVINRETRKLAIDNGKLENQIVMLKQASFVGARNYIARELHDILGHSLVVTIKLLEVSKIYYKMKKNRAINSLDNATLSIQKGFEGMKNIKDKDSTFIYNTTALEKEIKSMLKVVSISGIKVDFFIRGSKMILDEKLYDTLRKVATELVTNTLKHAKATNLLLSISLTDKEIILQTMDNGKGQKNLVKGNGLIGIDGRLSLVGGKARYTTDLDEGFSSNVNIPL